MDFATMLVVLLAIPLIAALLMAVLPSKAVPAAAYESIHILSVGAVCVLAIYLVVNEFVSGTAIEACGLWFRLDGLGSIFATLIGVIGLLTGIYSIAYVRHDIEIGNMGPGQVKQYYVFFSLFWL